VLRVLSEVARCAACTRIVFTYVHRGVIDHSQAFSGGDRILRNVRELGEPWTFGVLPEQLDELVGRAGLTLCEDMGADDYRVRYLPAW